MAITRAEAKRKILRTSTSKKMEEEADPGIVVIPTGR